MTEPRPRAFATVPLFVVADLQRSIDFYCEKLAFRDPNTWGDPPEFAMAHRNELEIMLSLAKSPEQVRPNGPDGSWDLYVRITDVSAEAEALKQVGVEIAQGPTTTFYGMKEIEVIDPDGYRICLAEDVSR